MKKKEADRLEALRSFYDSKYYGQIRPSAVIPRHLRQLARKLEIHENQQVLDVACGDGSWLLACAQAGAATYGVDLSPKAIAVCKTILPRGEFHATSAEALPFPDSRFDLVTCLGALEHFVNPDQALMEMVRVAKRDAQFLILVPNADFLTRRLGFFGGTLQIGAKEEVRTLAEWQKLFEKAGLLIEKRWRDLHVLSWAWISARAPVSMPLRALQAMALVVWPLGWQYQVYHLCRLHRP